MNLHVRLLKDICQSYGRTIFDDGALLPAVMQARYQLLNRGGVLAFEYDAATRPLSVVMAEQIAGLRQWAAQRTVAAE